MWSHLMSVATIVLGLQSGKNMKNMALRDPFCEPATRLNMMCCVSFLKLWKLALILFESWLAVKLEMRCVCQFLEELWWSVINFSTDSEGMWAKPLHQGKWLVWEQKSVSPAPGNRVWEGSHSEQTQRWENNKTELYIKLTAAANLRTQSSVILVSLIF